MTTTARLVDMSPRVKARLVGALLLITVVAGGFAQGFIGGSLIVSGDATATATNILGHEQLYRLVLDLLDWGQSWKMAEWLRYSHLPRPTPTVPRTGGLKGGSTVLCSIEGAVLGYEEP